MPARGCCSYRALTGCCWVMYEPVLLLPSEPKATLILLSYTATHKTPQISSFPPKKICSYRPDSCVSVVSCKPRQVPQPRLNYSRFPKQPRGENRETEKREKKFFPSSIPAGKQLPVCSTRSDQHQAQSQPVFSGRLLVVIKRDITPLQILHVSPHGSFQPWMSQNIGLLWFCFP